MPLFVFVSRRALLFSLSFFTIIDTICVIDDVGFARMSEMSQFFAHSFAVTLVIVAPA